MVTELNLLAVFKVLLDDSSKKQNEKQLYKIYRIVRKPVNEAKSKVSIEWII